jgi:hypothetical protein
LRLWQGYGYERVLRDEEPPRKAMRHVLESRLAGVVHTIGEYRFIGSTEYTRAQLIDMGVDAASV